MEKFKLILTLIAIAAIVLAGLSWTVIKIMVAFKILGM